jgi:cyclic pyranopterin phosphate synthase
MTLSHVDAAGRARMVDVGNKPVTARVAVAEGTVRMSAEAFAQVRDAAARKGDVLGTAELAGVMAAKRTSELVPLCHPVPLDTVEVVAAPLAEESAIRITATVRATARTGVEMEALVAVSVACCTVYDMIKAVDRGASIVAVRVRQKSGGTHGDWTAPDAKDSTVEVE